MKKINFVLGGCRSGKSRYALDLAENTESTIKVFIATCVPHDDEMKKRVQKHQEERNKTWNTIESPVNIADIILNQSKKDHIILVDCLTLWVNNLMITHGVKQIEDVIPHVNDLINALKATESRVILVSNEVGTGIVPENEIARLFRDIAGYVNQEVASNSDRVIFMVAGIPIFAK